MVNRGKFNRWGDKGRIRRLPFFASDSPCLQHLSPQEREERKQRILRFQEETGYAEAVKLLPEGFLSILEQEYQGIQELANTSSAKLLEQIGKTEIVRVRIEKAYERKYERIYEWARKPRNKSHQIVSLFLENMDKGLSVYDFVELVTRAKISENPYGAVHSMMSDAGNSYGRVFMVDNDLLVLVPELVADLPKLLKAYGIRK